MADDPKSPAPALSLLERNAADRKEQAAAKQPDAAPKKPTKPADEAAKP